MSGIAEAGRGDWAGMGWKKLRPGTKGAVALETAVIAMALFAVIGGLAVTGYTLGGLAALDHATKEAGRQIRIGAIRGNSDTAARNLICSEISVIIPSCTTSLMIYATSATTFAGLQPATVGTNGNLTSGFSPGGSKSAVLLQVAYVSPLSIPTASFSNVLLASTVVFRNEP